MANQMSFTDAEYSARRRTTKKETFLDMMDAIMPWEELAAMIKPFYFEGKRGRRPRGIELMLRMYFLQIWYDLSDEGVEDAICDSYAMRKFMKLDFVREQVPDATTLLAFRRIIEKHGISIEKTKSSVRSKVEHVFNILKNIFGYRKTAYRGLHKNLVRLEMSFACANLYMCAKAGGFNRG